MFEVPPYCSRFKIHPREFLLEGPLGQTKFSLVSPGCCPFTGVSSQELKTRRAKYMKQADMQDRSSILVDALIHGSAWEEPTNLLIAKLSKKYSKTRVGTKAAKKAELLNNTGAVLSPEEATGFRALAARANYLALDRPDVAFATKEL